MEEGHGKFMTIDSLFSIYAMAGGVDEVFIVSILQLPNPQVAIAMAEIA